MAFTLIEFFIFFNITLLINFVCRKFCSNKASTICLLLCNYIFYSYWDFRFSFLLLVLTTITFYCAKNINKKVFYYFGLTTPIMVLCFFKYFNFFLNTFDLKTLDIVLPIGISFYTFEIISYLVDVKKEKIEVETDFIVFATYISFFPNIISGPIERANNLLTQIKENKQITIKNIEIGIQIMVIGYFKKMVLADRLAVFVNDVYATPKAYNWLTVLFAILSYSIQIYMDFSGYSDIAIGCAKCFGYDLKKNFNLPYVSKSVTEFWRRWHISLSTWFKDYVYIPLGGNRKGKIRQYVNLIIVMTLSGLWHGASWNYVLWGLINGLLLCVEKMLFNAKSDKHNFIRIISTFVVISFTWIIFRAETFDKIIEIFVCIFSMQKGAFQPYLYSFLAFIVLIIATICAKKNSDYQINGYYPIQDLSTIKGLTLFFTFIGFIICLAYTNANPFVYFQF